MHPPDEFPVPDDCPRYGWRNNIWDKAEALEKSSVGAAALTRFDVKGYVFSSELLGYYLGNNPEGSRYNLNMHFQYLQMVLSTQDMQNRTQRALEKVKEEARNRVLNDPSLFGMQQEITTDWLEAGPTENEDVHNALGHFWMAVGSDVLVNRPRDGNPMTADIKSKVYVYDYYYYHGTVGGFLGGIADHDLRWLEEAGWARSFRVSGDDYIDNWSGPL